MTTDSDTVNVRRPEGVLMDGAAPKAPNVSGALTGFGCSRG
ncbi:MAG: hypothetical protein Q4A16_10245 [Lautropia sp.]|nr:hypothetical protein [Lautropia sp.]